MVCALGFSRAGAGALVFSKEAPDILAGVWRCLGRLGALPKTLVCDREGALHAGGGRPSEPFSRFCRPVAGWVGTSARRATRRLRALSSD